jgi:hypothetical protein
LIGIDLFALKTNNRSSKSHPFRTSTKNADLFSSCIHLLTLIAFNVHALVGCCAHHNHTSPLDGHDEIGCHSSLESDHDRSAGHDEDANHEHHDGNPCDHSQPCDEGRCVFVDARLVPLQLDLQTNALVAFGTSTPVIQPRVALATDPRVGFKLRFLSAGQRCELLQSWQI